MVTRSLVAFTLLASVFVACGRNEDDSWSEFVAEATDDLQGSIDRLKSEFGLGSYERYDWDQDTGQIVFSDAGVPKVTADIVMVGSTSTISDTWLWSWANDTIISEQSSELDAVRDFGRQRGYRKLYEAKWPADRVDGWQMTAIAAFILKAEGAYLSPGDNGATFMLLRNVRRVP